MVGGSSTVFTKFWYIFIPSINKSCIVALTWAMFCNKYHGSRSFNFRKTFPHSKIVQQKTAWNCCVLVYHKNIHHCKSMKSKFKIWLQQGFGREKDGNRSKFIGYNILKIRTVQIGSHIYCLFWANRKRTCKN